MQQTTLVLLKPDCVQKALCGAVISRFEQAGYFLHGARVTRLSTDILREHYAHVADKPFYPDLEAFMTESPVLALAFTGQDVIQRAREIVGPTDSRKAPKGTIRGDFGEDNMRNVVHASDSPESARIELQRFFREGEIL